jgi:hypothetical protein
MDEEKYKAQESMDGTPAMVEQHYFWIMFQCGPVSEFGVNGTTIEKIIEVLIERLEGFQKGPFKCTENTIAITHLQESLYWLEMRRKDRVDRGVEGKNEP